MLQQWFENFKDLADLEAQRSMASSALWMIGLTVVSCAISLVGLYALWKSLEQTRDAIKVTMLTEDNARKLGEANSRAYLYAETMEFSKSGRTAIITIKNSGATPAAMLCAGCEVKSVPRGKVRQSAIFGEYEYGGWHALPAGENRRFHVKFSKGIEFIDENKLKRRSSVNVETLGHVDANIIVIVGRIVWRDVFGQHLETGFAFYTEDVERLRVNIPSTVLPTFRLIDIDEVPEDWRTWDD